MKTRLLLLFASLLAPAAFGAAFDVKLSQINDGGTGFAERTITPTASGLSGFDSSKHPINVPFSSAGQTFLGTPTLANLNAFISGATIFANTTKADVLEAALFAADAGSTDAYAIALSPAITAYVDGAFYAFKANTANTGAATLNINSLGAKTIKKVAGGITTDLSDNDIRAGQWVIVQYDGTNMQMQSTLGNASGGGGSGTVSSGAANLLAYYPSAGTTVDDADGTAQARIGTASSTAATGSLALYGNATNTPDLAARRASADAVGPSIYLSKSRGSIASPGQTTSSDVLGYINFGGYTSASAWAESQGTVFVQATENFTNTARGTKVVLAMTAPGTTTNYSAFHLTTTTSNQTISAFRDMIVSAGAEDGSAHDVSISPSSTGSLNLGTSTTANVTIKGTGSILHDMVDRWRISGTNKALVGVSTGANNILTGSAADDFCFRGDAGNILFGAQSGSTVDFKIARSNGQVSAETTTASTSTTTGALISKGGLGVAGAINAGGDIVTQTIGKTLGVKSGSNALAGTFTLSSGAATVSTTAVDANSVVCMSLKTASGTITQAPYLTAITAGTSFVVAAAATDNSTYNWVIIKVN